MFLRSRSALPLGIDCKVWSVFSLKKIILAIFALCIGITPDTLGISSKIYSKLQVTQVPNE